MKYGLNKHVHVLIIRPEDSGVRELSMNETKPDAV